VTKLKQRNTRDPPERGDVNLPAPSGKPILYKPNLAEACAVDEFLKKYFGNKLLWTGCQAACCTVE
jgi:hypothetical protein